MEERTFYRGEERTPYRGDERVPGMGESDAGGHSHSLTIANRERVHITGVIGVDSFDDEEVNLETEMGMLTIRGEELQIKQLDLEKGQFAVEGCVSALQYASPRQRSVRQTRGRSFLERLLR